MSDRKESRGSSKNDRGAHKSRMPLRLRALLGGRTFPTWLRFLGLRIPDAVAIYVLFTLWRMYLRTYALSQSPYSLVVTAMATLGFIASYASLRYARIISRKVPSLWKWYWILIIAALYAGYFTRRSLAAGVTEPQGISASYIIVIAFLAAASLVAIAGMMRTRTNVLRLSGFLLAQALLVFAFAQPYIYCNFVDSRWDLPTLEQEAMEVVSGGRQTMIEVLINSTSEELWGMIAYFRENQDTIPEGAYGSPPLSMVASGVCERVNFGAALYLSTITWTSVGFGDLIPTAGSRGYAAAESILGYLFMAALAAVLIRWMRKPSRNYEEGDTDERT